MSRFKRSKIPTVPRRTRTDAKRTIARREEAEAAGRHRFAVAEFATKQPGSFDAKLAAVELGS